tara:strand:- start:46749 stop:47513 length:765 start_codon:yes stop_codon:yes gene_type:complete
MTLLSVNVNKVATLRNARGQNNPNLRQVTTDLLEYGAQGITVHPRPDQRHIKKQDVYELKELLTHYNTTNNTHIEFNIEGFPSPDFIELIQEVQPEQVTLVPDPPDAITSNAGWDCTHNKEFLIPIVETLHKFGARVSLFVDPIDVDPAFVEAFVGTQAERAELYTESFAKQFADGNKEAAISAYRKAADALLERGIELNAGHDLDLHNVGYLTRNIPEIKEVSIGHALICESLYLGFKTTISNYLSELKHHAH